MTDHFESNPTPLPQTGDDGATHGMALRDWFAGQALIGLLITNTEIAVDVYARAYEMADLMLTARMGAGRRHATTD